MTGLTGQPIFRPNGQVDAGVTEIIGKLTGRNQSNVIPGQQSTAAILGAIPTPQTQAASAYTRVTTPVAPRPAGSVQGATTGYKPPEGPDASGIDKNAPSGGNNGGGGGGVDLKNPNANPGPGWFWDAADGWKQDGGGGQAAPDLYAGIESAFDEVLGGLGGQQNEMFSAVRSNADIQKKGIDEQLGFGLQNLDKQRGGVRTEQANTLADLAQSLRDNARNVQMYLGARGAGGSSANDAASFALTKLFGKERAGVQKQGMAQLGDIDTAETNLRAKHSEMINGVETWANGQLADIQSKFNDLRNNIGTMKGQMRAQAIESLWNQYNAVQQQREQLAVAINEGARNRLAQLTNLKLELSKSSQFDPAEMTFSEYGFDPGSAYTPEDVDMFNPLAMAQRKKQQTI